MSGPVSSADNTLKISRTAEGYVLRVEGRGTMRHSPAALNFAMQILQAAPEPPAAPLELFIDLIDCEYLDSTFLGCILTMHRRFGNGRLSAAPKSAPPISPSPASRKISVCAPSEKRTKLFGSSNLQAVLNLLDLRPAPLERWRILPAERIDPSTQARHIMDCHRLLSELGGPHAPIFAAIADQLQRELHPADPPQ